MKVNLHLFLLFCTLLALFACGHKPYPHSLTAVDSLASVNPDSAIALINSLNNEMKSAPQSTQMYYQLLCIKANDKAYIPHTSDSLILPVLHYYIEKNDEQHLPEAYYYAGRVYRDLEDAPQALNYFEKALGALPENGGYKQKSKIYSQMGTLFLYQGMHNEALEIFKKSYLCNSSLKDSIGMVYNLRDIADANLNINKVDSSLYYYQAAYKLCKSLQRQDLINMVQSQIASLYMNLEKFDLAKVALKDALRDIERPNKSGIYSIAAELYYETGITDSANYYYTILVDSGTIYAQKAAYRNLAEIALDNGDSQLALQHLKAYFICTDSIEKIICTNNLQRMYSQYNYQLREQENLKLKTENEKKTHYILYSLTAFIIGVVFFFVYRQYNKRKRQQLKFQLQRVKQLKEESYKKSRLFIENNSIQIQRLEQELNNVTSINENLRKKLQEQKELLYHEIRQAEIEQNRRERTKNMLQDSDIYRVFKKRLLDPKGKVFVTTDEWMVIERVIRDACPDFFEKLSSIYDFNDYELRVCMFVKFGFSPSEIAKLTERPKETITSTRRRLYKRIFNIKGKPEEWDNFIHSL